MGREGAGFIFVTVDYVKKAIDNVFTIECAGIVGGISVRVGLCGIFYILIPVFFTDVC